MNDATALKQTAVVGSRVGLHARPVAMIAKAAGTMQAKVRIGRDGRDPVDARSTLLLMTLGARCGDEVVVEADGEGAAEALAAIVDLVQRDLDADGESR
jgi:phosphocarrier protein HPr